MSAPTKGSATSESRIEVEWLELVGDDTGGSTILSYHLQWDEGDPDATDFVDLIGLTSYFIGDSFTVFTNLAMKG